MAPPGRSDARARLLFSVAVTFEDARAVFAALVRESVDFVVIGSRIRGAFDLPDEDTA